MLTGEGARINWRQGKAAFLTSCRGGLRARQTSRGFATKGGGQSSGSTDQASGSSGRFGTHNPCHTFPHAVEFPIRAGSRGVSGAGVEMILAPLKTSTARSPPSVPDRRSYNGGRSRTR